MSNKYYPNLIERLREEIDAKTARKLPHITLSIEEAKALHSAIEDLSLLAELAELSSRELKTRHKDSEIILGLAAAVVVLGVLLVVIQSLWK